MENSGEKGGVESPKTLDQVANWVGATVMTAFFSSLDRCSCLNLNTADSDSDEDEDEEDTAVDEGSRRPFAPAGNNSSAPQN